MTDRIRFHRSPNGDWRWTRTARNNETVAAATEGYNNLDAAIANAERVNANVDPLNWVYDWTVPSA